MKGKIVVKKAKVVQALQIRNDESYSYYLELPAKRYFEFEEVCGSYLIIYPMKRFFWELQDQELFESNYIAVEKPSLSNFTYYSIM